MTALTYDQRKSLRRISRGQSVPKRMTADPIIRKCFTQDLPEPPTGDDLNIATWCDWEARLAHATNHTRITPYGRALLETLTTGHTP